MMSYTMHRTQILLDEWQYDALKARARGRGRSLSDLVREIVAAHLGGAGRGPADRLRGIEGVAEGPSDLAGRHDGYLYGGPAAPPIARPPRSVRPATRRRPGRTR